MSCRPIKRTLRDKGGVATVDGGSNRTTCGVAPIRRSSATQARVSSPVSPATAKPA